VDDIQGKFVWKPQWIRIPVIYGKLTPSGFSQGRYGRKHIQNRKTNGTDPTRRSQGKKKTIRFAKETHGAWMTGAQPDSRKQKELTPSSATPSHPKGDGSPKLRSTNMEV
jgi:hypothetical protein